MITREHDPRTDRRVRRTRDAIHRALIELMIEKGYEAVTVADIITKADVGRSTFYTHFTDKREVLYASIDELAGFLRAGSQVKGGRRLFGFSLMMFEHAHEQQELLRALLGRGGGAIVYERIRLVLADLVRDDLVPRVGPGATVPLDLVVDGVVGAYMALLSRWLDEREPHTPHEMDVAFRRLVIPGVVSGLGITAPEGAAGTEPR